MRQLQFQSDGRHTTGYVEDDSRLRIGTRVTLRDCSDPSRLWTVTGRAPRTVERSQIKSRWQVGGI